MNKKITAITAIVLSLVLMFASCAAPAANPEEPAKAEGHKFGFTCMTMNNPFFTTIEASVRAEVEAKGDTLITLDTKQDIATQLEQITNMIDQGIEALFLCPVDSEGIKPALDELAAKGIPVINFDTDVIDKDLVATVISSNNEYAGQVVGEAFAAKFPEGGKIAILDAPYADACVQRVAGFMKGIGDVPFEIVSQQNGKGDIGESLAIAEPILQANPDLIAFFCINDPSALGAFSAVQAAGLEDKVIIYGVDGSPDAKASIADGGLSGTGAQSPINIGKYCVEAAYKVIGGETIESVIKVPTFLIDETNVKEYGIDGWQ
ncbi:MAG: sugar ABC transporter substrate-binding protein [Oscillospiraceae bacterium]